MTSTGIAAKAVYDRETAYPLSPLQEGLLFHSLYEPKSGYYLVQMRARMQNLNRNAFQAAWRSVVQRHEALRTSFHFPEEGDPTQFVEPEVRLEWNEQDWSNLQQEETEHLLGELVGRDRARDFDLTEAPLMRFALVSVAPGMHEFVWTYHHALLDGWSVPLLLNEVARFYQASLNGSAVILPDPRPYRDYIVWLQNQSREQAKAFWRSTLGEFTGPTHLSVEQTAVDVPGNPRGKEQKLLSTAVSSRSRAFGQRQDVTLNTIVQGVWAILLSRYSGETRVVFGVTVAGRPAELSGAESMVGLFINTLPTSVEVDGSDLVIELLRKIQRDQVEGRRYEYTPLADIQEWIENRKGTPLFDSTVTFENYPIQAAATEAAAAGLTITALDVT